MPLGRVATTLPANTTTWHGTMTVLLDTAGDAHRMAVPPARFDMYGTIHKALRLCMNRTLERVGTTDATDDADLDDALAQLSMLLAHLRSHLKLENDHVHTAIEARRPGAAGTLEEEHAEHLESIHALEEEAVALRAAPAGERPALTARLYRHLALFVAENLHHMHGEETSGHAVLWDCYSDAELADIHQRILAGVAPELRMQVAPLMAAALSPQELTAVLLDMQAKAPPPAFDATLNMVRRLLDDRRWNKVAAALRLTA
jgi:hypothetical protein